MKFNLLIADDEKNIREGLARALSLEGYNTLLAEDGEAAWKLMSKEVVDLAIVDLRMPRLTGDEFLKKTASAYPTIPVVILTGHGTIENAVFAMQNGAYDFLTKPVNLDRLSILVKRALETRDLSRRHRELQKEVSLLRKKNSRGKMIGKSAATKRVIELIAQAAPSRASVLITGESGVGKELVADALHQASDRKDKPFIKVHCAALSESLLESELFGHEKGAFTGAVERRKGRFEMADGGTVFLDEIGEINQSIQIKILRVLQERSFERVGGEKTMKVDIRLIAATNRDLKEEIEKGEFREDLFYRLNVVNIDIPSLRERKEDIPLMISSFIKEFAAENNKNIEGIASDAASFLYAYSWPGNIRELRNCIESAVVLSRGSIITKEDLPPSIKKGKDDIFIHIPKGESLAQAEALIIRETIGFANGNKSRTADILGIGRKTLHRKILNYGMEDLLRNKR